MVWDHSLPVAYMDWGVDVLQYQTEIKILMDMCQRFNASAFGTVHHVGVLRCSLNCIATERQQISMDLCQSDLTPAHLALDHGLIMSMDWSQSGTNPDQSWFTQTCKNDHPFPCSAHLINEFAKVTIMVWDFTESLSFWCNFCHWKLSKQLSVQPVIKNFFNHIYTVKCFLKKEKFLQNYTSVSVLWKGFLQKIVIPNDTVHPMKNGHGFCCSLFCCGKYYKFLVNFYSLFTHILQDCTENKRSSSWKLCRHWWHRKLS